MTYEDIISIHARIRSDGLISACNLALQLSGVEAKVDTIRDAYSGLYGLLQSLLASNQRVEASLLLWGPKMFDPRARSARLIRKAVSSSNKVLVIGGAGVGKTWPAAAEIVLDVVEDMGNTFIKVISSTAGHAKNNIMAKIFRFHSESAIRLPGFTKSSSFTYKNVEIVSQVAIPEGESGKGRLTGFHPEPRSTPSPRFGEQTRVKAYVDEADTVPSGLWEGLDNLLASEDYIGSVQVVALTNPRDKSNAFAARAEPVGGWSIIDIDRDDTWISRDGWTVVRLDPAKSENVVKQEVVYPGMMTYQGFQNYVRKGKGSADYWIMGRAWYPEQTAEFVVVSPQFFDSALGLYTFQGDVIPCASLDPAFAEGGDDPILTTGRTGTAIAFTPTGGGKILFPAPLKNVLQIEQQFPIQKSDDPRVMGKQVMDVCGSLNVRPEWFVMDMTGNAHGLYGYLAAQFGTIMGITWGSAATEQKILAEDTKNAYERYDGIPTEMYFAFGTWLQFGQVKFAPIFAGYQGITSEFSNRRYYFHRGLQKLEDKTSFKARNEGKSPDKSDSAAMLLHLVRVRKSQNPNMLPDSKVAEQIRSGEIWNNVPKSSVDALDYYEI